MHAGSSFRDLWRSWWLQVSDGNLGDGGVGVVDVFVCDDVPRGSRGVIWRPRRKAAGLPHAAKLLSGLLALVPVERERGPHEDR